jgi:hypothetical protein
LVARKVINNDQMAALRKRPEVQTQLAQLEEQLAQYRKVDQEYRSRSATERIELEKSLTEKHEKEKNEAVNTVQQKAAEETKKMLHDSLLVVSQFLRLAAARRAEGENPEQDENLALEGILLQVYSGDETAVGTMLKLVQGTDDQAKSVSGDVLQTTCESVCRGRGHLYQILI